MDALLQAVEQRREALVSFCRDLVRIPTVNPPGAHYRECAELLGNRLQRLGFETLYLRAEGTPGDSDRWPRINLVARREGARPGPCVHFNGHLDVVPAGEGWSIDPWAGELRDGKLYGRGSCDMKGGIAAAVIAVEALLEVWPDFPGAIEISGTADEESGGFGGVAWLAGKGFFSKPRVDHVIIPEPLDVDRVCIGHRGLWWAEVETFGRIAHGSMPFLGDCAIRHMAAFLERLETELMPRLAARRTTMPVVPEQARASTLNLIAIHGGQPEGHRGLPSSCVADSCRLVIDRRYLIEEEPTAVEREIRDILEQLARERPGFAYRMRELQAVEPVLADPDQPVPRAVAAALRRVLGREPAFICSPGTYDQKHIRRIGRLEDCVAYGPGILDLAHQPDEFVGIEDMVTAAKVMGLAAMRLLGGPPDRTGPRLTG